MKFSTITKTTVLGLAAITLSALSVGTLNAQAATVATVTSPVSARLYTREAKLITNRALAPNTPWRVGDIISVYGEKYYQVATNEFLKAADSQLSGDAVAKYPIAKIVNGDTPIYYTVTKGDFPSARSLPLGSSWRVTSAVRDDSGQVFYEVGTNQWISATNVLLDRNTTYTNINKFDGHVGIGDTSNHQTTNNNNTNNNNSQNNNTSSKAPTVNAVQAAFLASINNERSTKGLSPLTLDSALTNTAMTRATEISTKFSHERPDGTMCYTAFPNESYSTEEENIAESSNSLFKNSATGFASNVMNEFRAETGTFTHYTNVMSPDVTKVGLGYYYDPATDSSYVAQDFM